MHSRITVCPVEIREALSSDRKKRVVQGLLNLEVFGLTIAIIHYHGQPNSDTRSERQTSDPAFLQRRRAAELCRTVLAIVSRDGRGRAAANTVFFESRNQFHAYQAFQLVSYVHPLDNQITIGSANSGVCMCVMIVLAMSKRNSNTAEIIIFLHRLVQVLVEYFKELEEESIRDNFVIIYELMDEMMDFGYPQTTESKILQEYVSFLPPSLSPLPEVG
jgi:Clathrin adaptor complex small chain